MGKYTAYCLFSHEITDFDQLFHDVDMSGASFDAPSGVTAIEPVVSIPMPPTGRSRKFSTDENQV